MTCPRLKKRDVARAVGVCGFEEVETYDSQDYGSRVVG